MVLLKAFLEGGKELPFWALAIRSVILYCALIMATRIMGHRQVGILTGHNYLVAAGIVSLAAIRMINPESSLTSAVVVVFAYAGVNVLLSFLDLKFPALIDRQPVILMRDGRLNKRNLLDSHVTLDNLLGQLRLKGAHNLSEIDTVVLEPTGKVSVIKKPGTLPLTRREMKLPDKPVNLPTILIYDGIVQEENLSTLGLNHAWLHERLAKEGFAQPAGIFLAMLESTGKLFISV